MPLYFSAHTTACLTKQALGKLMQELMRATEVKVRRLVASQIGGRMISEVEARDQPRVERFFESQRINCEWVMRIDLEAHDGSVMEY